MMQSTAPSQTIYKNYTMYTTKNHTFNDAVTL